MIVIRDLFKSFGSQPVLSGVSLTIPSGQTIAIVGPSGTGKSVLLKILTGLIEADAGEVLIDGQSMTEAKNGQMRRQICSQMGMLFQGAALLDSLTVYQNVAFPLLQRRELSAAQVREQSLRRLNDVGLKGSEGAMPGEISIGMRKRVGLARALVTNPSVMLFDEPNTGLDPKTGQEIYELIKATQKASGITAIVVSHEIPEVFQVCDRVAMLYKGVVQEEGPVESFLASVNPVVRQFIDGRTTGPIQMV